MTELNFKIRGMNCRACAALIEGELRELPGVEEARVDFDSNEAAVVCDNLIIDKKEIFKLVEELGSYNIQL